MYIVYFDSGTSNTRVYLLKEAIVLDMIKSAVGSKDSSISGSNEILLKEFKNLFEALLLRNAIEESQVSDIYASGMVTSPFGIKEVPHLTTPVSGKMLFDGIYTHYESIYLKRDVKLIRGVKTVKDDFKANPENIVNVNNMRGEEIEVFGVIPNFPQGWQNEDVALILPGSHTHIGYIKNNELFDIWSTFSGELFHAVSTSTVLANSISVSSDEIDTEMVILGAKYLKEHGLNRALYICHAMKIFHAGSNLHRRSYLEGLIAANIVSGFEKKAAESWKDIKRIAIAGKRNLTEVYEILFKDLLPDFETVTITADEKNSFALQGFLNIIK